MKLDHALDVIAHGTTAEAEDAYLAARRQLAEQPDTLATRLQRSQLTHAAAQRLG